MKLLDKIKDLYYKVGGKLTKPITISSGQQLTGEEVFRFRRQESKWQRVHSGFWKKRGERLIVKGGKTQAETVKTYRQKTPQRFSRFNQPVIKQRLNLESIKSRGEFKRRSTAMGKELERDYYSERIRYFRQQVNNSLSAYGDEELNKLFEKLNDRQIDYIMNQTIFSEYYFEHLYPLPGTGQEDAETRLNEHIETLKAELNRALTM